MSIGLLVMILAQQESESKLVFPKSQPNFAFARVSQDGRSIALTERSGSRAVTYTVNVPFVETIKDKDGNERRVTRMRQETRTRIQPVPMVAETYTVMVSQTKESIGEDGKVRRVVVQVPQTRTRMVRARDRSKPRIVKVSECTITDVDGQPVSDAEVVKRLAKRVPIVVLNGDNKLDPFYRAVLREDILLLKPPSPPSTKPQQKPAKKEDR